MKNPFKREKYVPKTLSGKPWEGRFRLTEYRLWNTDGLPLVKIKQTEGGKTEKQPTTVTDVWASVVHSQAELAELAAWQEAWRTDRRVAFSHPFPKVTTPNWMTDAQQRFEITDSPRRGQIRIKLEAEEFQVEGPAFSEQVLLAMLSLLKDGIHYGETGWFWYDNDYRIQGDYVGDSYTFFVVHKGQIVREEVSFFDSFDSGFDPSVFETEVFTKDSPPIWNSDPQRVETRQRFWRREFYTKTTTGQVHALRSDRPNLWVYSSPSGFIAESVLRSLGGVRRLLWVVIGLLALTLIRLW